MVIKKIKEAPKKLKQTRVARQFKIANKKLKKTPVAREFKKVGYTKFEIGFAAIVWGGGSLILVPRLALYLIKHPELRQSFAKSLKAPFKGRKP